MGHRDSASWLEPMLEPRSIAIVGASDREGSFGRTTVEQTLANGFGGKVYPVNPKLKDVLGLRCYPTLADLPAPPELAILAVANAALEEQVALAVKTGCRALAIFASGYVPNDATPPLTQRIARLVKDADIPLCGGNCMGFYNPTAGTHGSWFNVGRLEPGAIGLLSHSGTLFITLAANDKRYAFSLVVSPGQELNVTVADHIHFMLEQGRTRVIAMVLETVRDPANFVAALEKANARDVPIVAIKVGRTAESARLAKSHSGAIVGDDAAYEALFRKYGVQRATNADELMASAQLLAHPKRPAKGGLAAVLDSGGARGMLIDLASDCGVPFSRINKETEQRLRDRLEYGLEPVNPVDAWGTGHDAENIFHDCLKAVTDDPDTGMSVLFSDATNDDDPFSTAFSGIAQRVSATSPKPVVIGLHWSQLRGRKLAIELSRAGMPMLEGTENVLLAVKHAFAYRDFRALPALQPPPRPAKAVVERWRKRLAAGGTLGEVESLQLLADFGIATVKGEVVASREEAKAAAVKIGLPVAVKTASPEIHHKTDVDGVRLGLATAEAVGAAYDDLARRLGPQVLIAPMARPGTELALGIVRDAQFGPVVVLSAGGTLIEVLRDRQVALPALDSTRAKVLIDRLGVRRLLDGHRKRPAADIDKLADAIARFSVLAAELGDLIAEADVNPLIAGPEGCIAVDALVIPLSNRA